MHKMLVQASKVAIRGFDRPDDRRTFFVGAIGLRKDGCSVHARNEAAMARNPRAHAEARLVTRLGHGASIVYVARFSFGRMTLANAKPCPDCQKVLRSFRVQKVIYTTGPNTWGMMTF